MSKNCIGIFDSGYGGLTILKDIVEKLPQYDYVYLGDNARAPYGNKSFATVYEYALQGVEALFKKGCELVILACNTASAKALRSIQENDLKKWGNTKRVLGVIRPTTENINLYTKNNEVGLFATEGTILSNSYIIEIKKFFPQINVHQEACPMWVPLIENNECENIAADYFVQQHINNLLLPHPKIDAIVLACTHYPLLMPTIKKYLPNNVRLISQGKLVADALELYLQKHSDLEKTLLKNSHKSFLTTGDMLNFNERASGFFGNKIEAEVVTFNNLNSIL